MVLKPSAANTNLNALLRDELAKSIEAAKKLPFHERRRAILEISGLRSYESHVSTPYFLVDGTSFNSDIWHVRFYNDPTKSPLVIDFGIRLSDGSLLTDNRHDSVLHWIKMFLVLQSHPRYNGQRHNSGLYETRILQTALHFIDWILLNDDEFDIAHNGLSLVTLDNIKSYLKTTLGTPITHRIYEYPKHLSAWLKHKISYLTSAEYEAAIESFPQIEVLPEVEDRTLELNDDDLRKARAWIISRRIISRRDGNLHFNPSSFQKDAYQNTLYGRHLNFRAVEDLRFSDAPKREYPGVPIAKSPIDGTLLGDIQQALKVLRKICIIEAHYSGAGISGDGILAIRAADVFSYIDTPKTEGHFSTLPHNVVNNLLGDCFQFYVDHAKTLLTYIVEFFKLKVIHGFKRGSDVDTLDKAVSTLTLAGASGIRPSIWYNATQYSNHVAYLSSLRSDESLFELYRIVLGSFLVIVGGLTSKRQGELIDLSAANCLEPMINPYLVDSEHLEYSMHYLARKTGSRGKREEASVGITLQVAKMLWDFISFRAELVNMQQLPNSSHLLFTIAPVQIEFLPLIPSRYNSILDCVCDYYVTPTIMIEGVQHRYYVRQHQLRRFCALAFYHADKHGRIEVIQHLLGHSDPEHAHAYITDTFPGVVLLEAKAQRITGALLSENDKLEGLSQVKEYILDRFGVSDVHLKTVDEIEEDYSELIGEGLFSVSETPDYFTRQASIFQKVMKMLETRIIW